jgi:nickel transport protein
MPAIVLRRLRAQGNAVPASPHLVAVSRATVVALLALGALPAVAHQTLHEVRRGAAVGVRAWESDGEALAGVSYQVYSPLDRQRPWQEGRTDRAGWLAFVPGQPGTWRVRVIEASGHGLDIEVEIAPPGGPPTAALAGPGLAPLLRPVLGLVALVTVFAGLVLARRKHDRAPPR